jgi:tetratricopeptide (TPR) repeat protein
MGILGKLFGGTGAKSSAKLKQAARLLDAGKIEEAAELVAVQRAEIIDDGSDAQLASLTEVRKHLLSAYLKAEQFEQAMTLGEELAQDDPSALVHVSEALANTELIDPRMLHLVQAAYRADAKEKRLLIAVAKRLLNRKGDTLDTDELAFITDTAAEFALWKEGQGFLADYCLNDNRRDAAALVIYRNAYPNRKADRRLRDVLLESLIINEEMDDFAAEVYKDTVETGEHNDALRLLAEYYIAQKEITQATIPYIIRALEKTQLSQDALSALSGFVLSAKRDFIDRGDLSLSIYRQAYADRDLLAFLGEHLAQANRFDAEAIEIMTKAFELRMVSKRAILILTEHCLANDREDDFAIHVYESYLSTWPDRPQRRIYGILAHYYAGLTRVDEQAQKIYEEALDDSPTDPIINVILARAYHAADRREAAAEDVYRHAFPIADGDTKIELATILAEMRVAANDYNEETLQYLTVMGQPKHGPLKDSYHQALTSCFLAAGRRGEQAQQAYFELFRRTEGSSELNPRLVTLLADIIKERGVAPEADSIELRVYYKLFAQNKFSTDAEISFTLLEDALTQEGRPVNMLHLAVRCFEADVDRLVGLIKRLGREKLLLDIGDFYIEHYNFEQAAAAYGASFELSPTDETRYRLAKIQLLEGQPKRALEHLNQLDAPAFDVKRRYWQAVGNQQLGHTKVAAQQLAELEQADGVPPYLLKLRHAINLELTGNLEDGLELYEQLVGTVEYPQFDRWLTLQRGIVLMRLERLEDARLHLEDVHRHNPSGRAEQLFLSLALFFLGCKQLENEDFDQALPVFIRAVEVNRNHRLLRQVIVELLSFYGEQAFFNSQLERATRIFEVANRILPKRVETKTYLAYSYHRLKDYAKAIIYYRDISWTDENPRLERSHAYAYIDNGQQHKAWRVFLDLARRGNLLKENFPRLVACYLADTESAGGRAWEPVEFPPDCDGLLLSALLVHDSLYKKATELLEELVKNDGANAQLRWYLGQAYAKMGKRELAVHNWLALTKLIAESPVSPEMKTRQFTEIGLAFVAAGYAPEAMQTWEQLRQLSEDNADLPVLYGATLDLNAYQLARKDQNTLAREEWKKALSFDADSPAIVQNAAIVSLLLDDYEAAETLFSKLAKVWQSAMRAQPKEYAHLAVWINHLEKAMNTLELTKGRPEFDLTKVRAEDVIDYYQKANQFYWILGLDKRASQQQIEADYFRLIKIFNPERHADDFMLVEESYTNLFTDPQRREIIDLFVFNPVDVNAVRSRLSHLPRDGSISFEKLDLPKTVPPPDYQQLEPTKIDIATLTQPLQNLLEINFKIPDWTVL